jgi:hypothetical protein
MKYIEEHLNRDWDWNLLSLKQNLSMEFIEKHLDKPWNWTNIYINPFITTKNILILQKYKEHLAVFKIQKFWFNIKTNPCSKLCQKLVYKFYDEVVAPIYM